ncbi:membrane trafficking protein [Acetivibrio mesophilus]|uniref:Membrane trafficking protein n=1 Tax=Acetivibrio mesophilus TaxID=2487273 RepID=A0A4Q0I3P0_9FIRM|nr:membrane trafficking protein [Acetivibrio mesophilus]ODM26672.1 membrane trafficking protein [Clostridium sp. Bc-iso-3]RXE58894.1 membrane trafficking protein [Acetivibrio mesophilus]HHV28441.1 membrane trafficking protein [Clostridium sp.]
MVDINKKLSELFGKMDEKVLQKKINTAIEMLKNGDLDDLSKKLNKMDKNELLEKINEFDESKLKEFNIDKNEIRQKVTDADLSKLSQMLGENGDEIVDKLKGLLEKA